MCLPGTVETVRASVEREGIPRVDRRAALLGAAGAALAVALPERAVASRRRPKNVQDLTHVFRAGFPVYAGNNPTRRTLVTVEANGFYKQEWTFDEHSGTHMDAPGHFIAAGRRAHAITAQELVAVPLAVVDISSRVAASPDAVVAPDDLRRFERRHGRIKRGSLVCMYSGWESRVSSQALFRNADASGTYHFPGFGKDALDWLLAERRITGIGVDTLSLDPGNSSTFPVHVTLLGHDKYGLENLANLSRIPPRGATAFVGLIPWDQGSGGPCRVIATWGGREDDD